MASKKSRRHRLSRPPDERDRKPSFSRRGTSRHNVSLQSGVVVSIIIRFLTPWDYDRTRPLPGVIVAIGYNHRKIEACGRRHRRPHGIISPRKTRKPGPPHSSGTAHPAARSDQYKPYGTTSAKRTRPSQSHSTSASKPRSASAAESNTTRAPRDR